MISIVSLNVFLDASSNGPLASYVKLRVVHARGMSGTFPPPLRASDPDMHHGTCLTHVPWCMPGSLTRGILNSRWRGKCSRHSWCMRNPRFYVSGKRPMYWYRYLAARSSMMVILRVIVSPKLCHPMMTSSNGSIFRVTGILCGEFTGPRWISLTQASDTELWYFFDLRLSQQLSKQWRRCWFETTLSSIWRHGNADHSQTRSRCLTVISNHAKQAALFQACVYSSTITKRRTCSSVELLDFAYASFRIITTWHWALPSIIKINDL